MVAAQQLAIAIIHEQEAIIGPLAWNVAKQVSGLTIQSHEQVRLVQSSRTVLAGLVGKYERLFGPASREVCREAVRSLLPEADSKDIPDILK